MRNLMKKFAFLTLLFVSFAGLASAQTSLTQTTLAAAQNVGASGGASGYTTGNFDTTINLTSATGVQVGNGVNPVTIVYVGGEAEGILSLVTGQTTIYNVLRGMMGTKIGPHPSGDMVLIQATSPQYGGGAGSGGFQVVDPPLNGACTTVNTLYTPWVNVITGWQWLCSTITTTWVPGFNNPMPKSNTKLVADAAGVVLPSGPLFELGGGTNAVTGFTIPVGCNATAYGGCQFTALPTTAWTWTTAGNINVAGTAVAFHAIIFMWDATTSKWEPLQSK